MPNKHTVSDLIKLTAIAWASGEFTEDELTNKLQSDYGITDENDIAIIFNGCNELQIGLKNSLMHLAGLSKKDLNKKVVMN
jgi:hypothetical protein